MLNDEIDAKMYHLLIVITMVIKYENTPLTIKFQIHCCFHFLSLLFTASCTQGTDYRVNIVALSVNILSFMS